MTHSPEETIVFGRDLAMELQPPCLVLIEGELGSGKTTLVKGLVAGLGAGREEEVTSPSFTLVHEYGGAPKVYHVDLYRVETEAELSTLGLEDLLGPLSIVLIEWGGKLAQRSLAPGIRVKLEHLTGENRRITVERLVS